MTSEIGSWDVINIGIDITGWEQEILPKNHDMKIPVASPDW